jgi:hypothetical protein
MLFLKQNPASGLERTERHFRFLLRKVKFFLIYNKKKRVSCEGLLRQGKEYHLLDRGIRVHNRKLIDGRQSILHIITNSH